MINKLGYAHLYDWQQKILKTKHKNEVKVSKSWETLEEAENALNAKIEAIANLNEGENYKTSLKGEKMI